MDDETSKPPDTPNLHSSELDLFGALAGFHLKAMDGCERRISTMRMCALPVNGYIY
jgi:hypothetical protein